MQELFVDLHISAEEYLRHYKGVGKSVIARDHRGRRVQFPANILQRFVSHTGIQGHFVIRFGDDNKFIGIERLN